MRACFLLNALRLRTPEPIKPKGVYADRAVNVRFLPKGSSLKNMPNKPL